MTEREKMTAGGLYFGSDPQLMADKKRARTLAEAFNRSSEDEPEARLAILRQLLGGFGDRLLIKPPFHCDYGYNIFLGENVLINFDCIFLDAAPITVGNNVLIGPKTCLYAVEHPLDAALRVAGVNIAKPVTIEDNVWLGGGVTVVPGVTIGAGAVVGAGSVVTQDIPAGALAVGNPARVIRFLNKE